MAGNGVDLYGRGRCARATEKVVAAASRADADRVSCVPMDDTSGRSSHPKVAKAYTHVEGLVAQRLGEGAGENNGFGTTVVRRLGRLHQSEQEVLEAAGRVRCRVSCVPMVLSPCYRVPPSDWPGRCTIGVEEVALGLRFCIEFIILRRCIGHLPRHARV